LKTVLYAYPLLKTVGEDYAEHIRNKALLSYDSGKSAEQLAVYLAEEILRKNCLEWLKDVIEQTLSKMTPLERSLIETRYFGKKKREDLFPVGQAWSERKYFRCQQKVGEKIGGMLSVAGVTKEVFDRELADLDLISKIHRHVEEGK
jgi:hypothetical protein